MPIKGMIFDIDGTLIDTNPAHVEAWRRAFGRFGFEVPTERIVVEIGKGGDKLVPSVLGTEMEAKQGDALRKAQKAAFLAIASEERFRVFPGAREIFDVLGQRGISTALATSSDDKHLEATFASAGVDFRRLANVVVTNSDADASKPSPDLLLAALEELRVPAAQCAMVGDTVYDGQACRGAGIVFLGVLTGPATETELAEAGARGVYEDVARLLADLDRALAIASLTSAATR
jgi:phosphoglycolate phosphatase-like HAD superfamily hydrolase